MRTGCVPGDRAGLFSEGPGSTPVTSGTFHGLVFPRGTDPVTLYAVLGEFKFARDSGRKTGSS